MEHQNQCQLDVDHEDEDADEMAMMTVMMKAMKLIMTVFLMALPRLKMATKIATQ